MKIISIILAISLASCITVSRKACIKKRELAVCERTKTRDSRENFIGWGVCKKINEENIEYFNAIKKCVLK